MKEYFTPERYSLIERVDDLIFRQYMTDEINIIKSVKRDILIDIGSGYGRIVPLIQDQFEKIISIDNSRPMIVELKKRYSDIYAIQADATYLNNILSVQEKSLIIVLQNTLGTWEGNYKELLKNISLFAKENDSEVILSICKADALKTWGLQLYSKLESLVGKPDYMKCDLEAGVF